MNETFKARFWAKVMKTPDCWVWTGKLMTSGYGVMSVGHSGSIGAHRASYEMEYGPFDKRLYVCHHCDNKRCVRPDHLFLGTQKDNMQDCVAKGGLKNAYRWTTENHPFKGKPMPEHLKLAMSERKKKPFKILSPDGELIVGENLTDFCRKNGLNQGAMWSLINGRGPSSKHKGYRRAP